MCAERCFKGIKNNREKKNYNLNISYTRQYYMVLYYIILDDGHGAFVYTRHIFWPLYTHANRHIKRLIISLQQRLLLLGIIIFFYPSIRYFYFFFFYIGTTLLSAVLYSIIKLKFLCILYTYTATVVVYYIFVCIKTKFIKKIIPWSLLILFLQIDML